MMVIGVESSQLNSCTILLGRSPGTDELGFLDLHIFLYTSYSSSCGISDREGFARSSFILGGKFDILIGWYS